VSVPISIAKYEKEVVCDVVPIDDTSYFGVRDNLIRKLYMTTSPIRLVSNTRRKR